MIWVAALKQLNIDWTRFFWSSTHKHQHEEMLHRKHKHTQVWEVLAGNLSPVFRAGPLGDRGECLSWFMGSSICVCLFLILFFYFGCLLEGGWIGNILLCLGFSLKKIWAIKAFERHSGVMDSCYRVVFEMFKSPFVVRIFKFFLDINWYSKNKPNSYVNKFRESEWIQIRRVQKQRKTPLMSLELPWLTLIFVLMTCI